MLRLEIVEVEPERGHARLMKQRFVAPVERRPDELPFGRRVPIGCRCDRTREGGEADQPRLSAVALPHELPNVQLATFTHLRSARVPDVGVVLPDHYLRRPGSGLEVLYEETESFGHVAVSKVPRRSPAAKHRAVVLFRVLRDPGVLFCVKEFV